MGLTEEVWEGEVVSETETFSPVLDHIPFSKSKTGWCNDGHHAPSATSKGCPGVVGGTPWPDPHDRRKRIPNPARRCPCECHRRDLD